MNRPLNKKSIYEMFRACRLCGSGGGYKMPIIQNIVDLGENELKLKEKINKCVQIDVQLDDKLPPLICELCIDKINEFYDFIQLCQMNNSKIRSVLGLSLKPSYNSSQTDSDCILGKLSPICRPESDDDELLMETKVKMKKQAGGHVTKPETLKSNQKQVHNSPSPSHSKRATSTPKTDAPKTKTKTYPKVKAVYSKRKSEVEILKEDLPIIKIKPKVKPRSPSPTVKRLTRKYSETDMPRIKVKEEFKLKKEQLVEVKAEKPKVKKSLLSPQPEEIIEKPKAKKRPESSAPSKSAPSKSAPSKSAPPAKKAKLSQKPPHPPKPQRKAPTPPPPAKEYECRICKMKFKSLGGHMKSHDVLYTEMRLSCRPCAEWFLTAEEANTHHKAHKSVDKPYRCQRCCGEFPLIEDYDEHVADYCPPYFESEPDIKCESCWNEYPTQLTYDEHRCLGEDGRPGGMCSKCDIFCPLLKGLKKHEPKCNRLKYGGVSAIVDLDVAKSLRNAQIRFVKCDKLLKRAVGNSYDVSKVKPNHDLDKQKVYPYNALYQGLKLKYEPNAMVKIPSLLLEENNLNWDSPSDTDIDESEAKVKSLLNLCVKVVHSNKLLRKKEMNKINGEFDEIDEQNDLETSVDDLINNLHDDDKNNVKNDDPEDKNDDDKKNNVKNDDPEDKNDDSNDKKNNVKNDDSDDKKNNDKNDDSDDKNDDVMSKSSFVIDISEVRSLAGLGVSDKPVNGSEN